MREVFNKNGFFLLFRKVGNSKKCIEGSGDLEQNYVLTWFIGLAIGIDDKDVNVPPIADAKILPLLLSLKV